MPQDRADQTTQRQAGEAVIEELRLLIQDVRSWIEAIPVPAEQILPDSVPMPDVVGSASMALRHSVSDATLESDQLGVAVAALNAHADTLSATTEHAAWVVRERGDRIDAMLAEIHRIRTDTPAA